ncbi:MAG: hypothetical protein JWQ11_2537 [Rhizobacter sp.]|nr:hypothetical protein [Rhizobacter sp.]
MASISRIAPATAQRPRTLATAQAREAGPPLSGIKYTYVLPATDRPKTVRFAEPQELPPPLPPKMRQHQPLSTLTRGAAVPPGKALQSALKTEVAADEPKAAAKLPAASSRQGRPRRLVEPPFNFADLHRAQDSLKHIFFRGYDRTIRINHDRSYRVTVGTGYAVKIDALHRPGTELLIMPGGAMWLAGKEVVSSSDAPTRRKAGERINMARRLADALLTRHPGRIDSERAINTSR